jgi:hypothetical protein
MLKKWLSLTLVAAVGMATLTACTDNTKIKALVEQSLNKQKEVKSYKFDGSLSLKLSDTMMASSNPLTNGILALAKESKLEWNGASTTDPVQFESDFKLTPKGSTTSMAIPILIKDSKLYFNMPAINKPDEYYAVDLQQSSKDSKTPLNLDTLKNTSQVTAALSSLFINEVDAKWFNESKEPVKLKDGTLAKSVTIEITKNNEKDFTTLVQSKLPEFLQTLQTNGLISATQADNFKNGPAKSLQIQAPGKLNIAIDDQGFIRDQTFELTFSITAANGSASSNQFTIHQSIDNINQAPAFTKEVPKNVKNFDELLKSVMGMSGKVK